MYNEFVKNITKENDPVRQKALYNEKTLIGRLHQYFLIYVNFLFFIEIFSPQPYNNDSDGISVIENIVRSPEASNKCLARKFRPCRMAGLIL